MKFSLIYLGKTLKIAKYRFYMGSFSFLIYLFLATLGLVAMHKLSLVVVRGGSSLAAVCGLLIAVASLVAEQGSVVVALSGNLFFFSKLSPTLGGSMQ